MTIPAIQSDRRLMLATGVDADSDAYIPGKVQYDATGRLYEQFDDLGNQDVLVARLMEDPQNPGQMILDDDFGTDGLAVLDAGTYDDLLDLKVDAAGRIVAGGEADGQWWAARFTADGDLDTTFGTVSGQSRTGWRTVDFTGSGTETFAGLELYPDGRVLLGGYKGSNVILARLTAAGDDDTSFSDDGQATLGGIYAEAALDLALQPDGRIVVAGMWFGSSPYNYQVLAGRVNADGTMDSSFGDGGWTRIELTGVNFNAEYAVSLAIQADGKVVLAGRVDSGGETELFVARLSGLTRHYAMQDANWTITGIINPETGQAVERYVFTPYGGRTVLDSAFESRSTSSFGWIVGHQGLAVDTETGLIYNRARYLDTSMGRFLQRDFLGFIDGRDLYEYVASRPLRSVDPTGNKRGDCQTVGTHVWETKWNVVAIVPGKVIGSTGANTHKALYRAVYVKRAFILTYCCDQCDAGYFKWRIQYIAGREDASQTEDSADAIGGGVPLPIPLGFGQVVDFSNLLDLWNDRTGRDDSLPQFLAWSKPPSSIRWANKSGPTPPFTALSPIVFTEQVTEEGGGLGGLFSVQTVNYRLVTTATCRGKSATTTTARKPACPSFPRLATQWD